MTRALEQSLSDRISNKICESLKLLLSAVHKKARPRDGHMGVSIISSTPEGLLYRFLENIDILWPRWKTLGIIAGDLSLLSLYPFSIFS